MNFKQKGTGPYLLSLRLEVELKVLQILEGTCFCADSRKPPGKVRRALILNGGMGAGPQALQHTGPCFDLSH